jgi:hypothetical protein
MEYNTTAKSVYDTALSLLGYTDSPTTQQRAVAVFNKVYYELHRAINGNAEFQPISALSNVLKLPEKTLVSVMPLGVAEMFALGEGDGELQQYFAIAYERAKARINKIDTVVDEIPMPTVSEV